MTLLDHTAKINKTMKISKAQQKLVHLQLSNNLQSMMVKSQILTSMIIEIQNKTKKQNKLLKQIKLQMIIQLNILLSTNKMKTNHTHLNALLLELENANNQMGQR